VPHHVSNIVFVDLYGVVFGPHEICKVAYYGAWRRLYVPVFVLDTGNKTLGLPLPLPQDVVQVREFFVFVLVICAEKKTLEWRVIAVISLLLRHPE
jgi:hypothetical protein